MVDTNYVGSVVKILETPLQHVLNEQISITQFRVQLPQVRYNRIVTLMFWGNLARDVASYYKVNDYIMIEGYLSFRDKTNNKLTKKSSKKAYITVSKIYPLRLSISK
jgi:hypothetical protein